MSGTAAPAIAAETAEQALARAQAAAQAKRFNEAAGICNDVLVAAPDNASALALLGMIAAHTNDPERGITLLERAVTLRPGVASWYANLSALYRMVYRMQDALKVGQEAIRLDPQNADHLVNLSLVFTDVDDREHAVACLLRALGLRPDHADGHLALGQNLLAMGDFPSGWLEYEWRNQTEAGKGTLPKMTSAAWNGMRIPQGRLLMVGDQGYGDTIQFARYLPLIADRCQELILGCSAEMGPLLATIPGVKQYCHRWTDVPGHAAHCRLSSVPGLLHTTLDNIPAKVPYLFADPARVAAWRERLAARLPHGVRRIGLAWTGRPTHPNDRRRSMPLARLAPLASAGRASFVSLQKPMPASDEASLALFPELADISGELTDFGETAAVIANLDLVITVDTAMGHLAGALGKPVWILLPKASDWRWLLERSDSPWYPTVRLFRQQVPGNWDPVLAEVSAALAGESRASAEGIAAD
ncbi:MAG TPA: tetratricopeptide repeat-containing glycosyltransferase family protein [Acetobacteraceae bacterium]|jgi:Tfp pilus assembly protein PilF|nr:tetratricopeptide repeat-containing glycosyltransferase family protein [Acetobacteraceae bacterium]